MAAIGKNRQDLKPLDPDGRLFADRLGTYRGDFESMNVLNPQPGKSYIRARCLDLKEQRHWDGRRVLHFQQKGYEIPPPGGETLGPPVTLNQGTHLDSMSDKIFGDVILMRIDTNKVIEKQKLHEEKAQAHLIGSTVAWGEGENERRPIHFKIEGHGFRRADRPTDYEDR